MRHRSRTSLRWSGERRGFTLVLIVLMMTVFFGCAAFAVDAALMYSYRAQLQTTADAAALAGAAALANGAADGSADTAVHYAALNKVGLSTTSLANGDVVPGTWTQGGGFVATGGWTTGSPFAVKTTTRYGGSYIFSKLFGFSTKNLTATAVAVRGSIGAAQCVRPWAVPYQDLLDHLGGGFSALTHNLTTAEVTQLAAATLADTLQLNQAGTEGVPHNLRAIQLPAGEYANGTDGSPWGNSGSTYRTAIGTDCATLNTMMGGHSVGVDDWLETIPGQKVGPTSQGVDDLLCATSPCATAVRVNVAIWDRYGDSPHGFCGGCYHVKYMGVFYVTGYDTGTNSVKGYFSALTDASASGFVPTPGPISKNALVQ